MTQPHRYRLLALLLAVAIALPGTAAEPVLNAHGGLQLSTPWHGDYGEPGGISITVDGVDVCSPRYAQVVLGESTDHAVLRPRRQDLSDAAGWPAVPVMPGWLAIDPASGRVKFATGDTAPPTLQQLSDVVLGGPTARTALVDDKVLYLATGGPSSGVLVIDLTAPTPRVRARIALPGFATLLARDGDYLYVYGSYQFSVIDVTDPFAPRLVNSIHDRWRVGDYQQALFAERGRILLLSAHFATLLQQRRAGNIEVLGRCPLPFAPTGSVTAARQRTLVTADSGSYELDWRERSPRVEHVQDHRWAAAPRLLQRVGRRYIAAAGDDLILLARGRKDRLDVVARTLCPQVVGIVAISSSRVAVLTAAAADKPSGDLRLYALKRDDLRSPPLALTREPDLMAGKPIANAAALAGSGKQLVVCDARYGPRLYRVDDDRFITGGRLFLGGTARAMAVQGKHLMLAKRGATVLDLGDPDQPQAVGTCYVPHGEFGLDIVPALERPLCYLLTGPPLRGCLLDISRPAAPVVLNAELPAGAAVWYGDHLLVLDTDAAELQCCRVSADREVATVQRLAVPMLERGGQARLRLVGRRIYAAIASRRQLQFMVFDVADPAASRMLGSTAVERSFTGATSGPGLCVSRGIAYIGGAAGGGVAVIDCRTPTAPAAAGFIDHLDPADFSRSLDRPDEVLVVGDQLVVGDINNGLFLFTFSNPERTTATLAATAPAPAAQTVNGAALARRGRHLYSTNGYDLNIFTLSAPTDVPRGKLAVTRHPGSR
jgi:hypothetical protein